MKGIIAMNTSPTRLDTKRPAAGRRIESTRERPQKARGLPEQSALTRAADAWKGGWAVRLAQNRNRKIYGLEAARPDRLLKNIEALVPLFDDDLTLANAAFAQAGLEERITLHTLGSERRYRLVSADGEERSISILVALRRVAGRCQGGALIVLGRTRLPIYVVPEEYGEEVRWLVAANGTELTASLVHDLFLSVFGDDASATFRLSPLAGSDVFQTPWR